MPPQLGSAGGAAARAPCAKRSLRSTAVNQPAQTSSRPTPTPSQTHSGSNSAGKTALRAADKAQSEISGTAAQEFTSLPRACPQHSNYSAHGARRLRRSHAPRPRVRSKKKPPPGRPRDRRCSLHALGAAEQKEGGQQSGAAASRGWARAARAPASSGGGRRGREGDRGPTSGAVAAAAGARDCSAGACPGCMDGRGAGGSRRRNWRFSVARVVLFLASGVGATCVGRSRVTSDARRVSVEAGERCELAFPRVSARFCAHWRARARKRAAGRRRAASV